LSKLIISTTAMLVSQQWTSNEPQFITSV